MSGIPVQAMSDGLAELLAGPCRAHPGCATPAIPALVTFHPSNPGEQRVVMLCARGHYGFETTSLALRYVDPASN